MALYGKFWVAHSSAPIFYLPIFLALARQAINWVTAPQFPPSPPKIISNANVCTIEYVDDECLYRRMPAVEKLRQERLQIIALYASAR
jgi:hypothetical protein